MSGFASIVLAFLAVYWEYITAHPRAALWAASAICLIITSYRVWAREHDRVAELTAKNAALESTLAPVPTITIEIKEVLVEATGAKAAYCFLDVTLHNLSERAPCIITDWQVSLTVKDQTKSSSMLAELQGKQLANYTEAYNRNDIPINTPYYIGENGLPMIEAIKEEIVSIRSLITEERPLRRGFPQSGWIGFLVSVDHAWPHYTVDSPVEGEVEHVIYKTTTVKAVSLEIIDGYGGRHSGWKKRPFSIDWADRQIIPRNSLMVRPRSC